MKKVSTLLLLALLVSLVFQVAPARASTQTEIQTSIDAGLAYLAGIQNVDGSWSGDYPVGITCTAVAKFQDRAYELGYSSPWDIAYPYTANVTLAYQYIFANAHTQTPLAVQTAGDPDTNGNGYGVWFASPSSAPFYSEVNYETGLCLMAMASSKMPDHLNEGALDYDADSSPDTFGELSQEGVDFLAWSQNDTGVNRGGWRYGFNPQDSDASVTGFSTLGLAFAESFGANIPAFVKTELDNWITYSQCADGGAGYTACPFTNLYRTGHLITMMAFVGDTPATPRMNNALSYLETNWGLPFPDGTNYLGLWSVMKGLVSSGVNLLDLDGGGTRDDDWHNADPTTGKDLASHIIGSQQVDGGWGAGNFFEGNSAALKATFALMILEKAAPPPPNVAPTDINLSPNSVAENQPVGTTVGTLTTTDPDAGDTHTYSLGCAVPGVDDASFSILGDALKTAAVFDYETKNTYAVCVRTDDGNGGTYDENFTINVTDMNKAPTDISLSNNTVRENQPVGTTVGTLSTTDPDAGDTHTYSFCRGTDDASFSIVGDALKTAEVFDYETKTSYDICVRTDDGNGGTYDEDFTINVTDVNEALTTLVFRSNGANDGTLRESSETSGIANFKESTSPLINVGDDHLKRQYKGVLDFDTSSIPDNAVITNARLQIKGMILSATVYAKLGNLVADITNPYFGTSTALQFQDFRLRAKATNVGTFTRTTTFYKWMTLKVNNASLFAVNKTGHTQFRLRFTIDDSNDAIKDMLRFLSGNFWNAADRPVLVITYYVP